MNCFVIYPTVISLDFFALFSSDTFFREVNVVSTCKIFIHVRIYGSVRVLD